MRVGSSAYYFYSRDLLLCCGANFICGRLYSVFNVFGVHNIIILLSNNCTEDGSAGKADRNTGGQKMGKPKKEIQGN